MSDDFTIQSHSGPYVVHFHEDGLEALDAGDLAGLHFIIDARVAELYRHKMSHVLNSSSVLLVAATEDAKSLERMPDYVEHLVARSIRRDHTLVAIGGGIIQDITCFLSATLLRGLAWRFYPTTLLAQADSCIGSKSSINCSKAKNILGTFTPPNEVVISTRFLDTLAAVDIRSGVGEMLKVHAIAGPADFDRIGGVYDHIFSDRCAMVGFIRNSLVIKKNYIERDEFDRGPRLVFNYGHSFGHAIEAATDFAVPHGIAVSLGMDMANWIAVQKGLAPQDHWARMHPVLRKNFHGYESMGIPVERVVAALGKDKKNVGAGTVTLILPGADGRVARGVHAADDAFTALCRTYLQDVLVA